MCSQLSAHRLKLSNTEFTKKLFIFFITFSICIVTNAQSLKSFSDEYGKYGFKDENEKIIIPAKFEFAQPFREGLAAVMSNNKWGYIDEKGLEIIPFKYDNARAFSEDLAAVCQSGKCGFIDKKDVLIVPFKYQGTDNFSSGLALVFNDGKCGFIDKTGLEKIPLQYDRAGAFSDGVAPILVSGKWGLIDVTGKSIVVPKYEEMYPFAEGLSCVKLNSKYGYIDKTGKEVIPLIYDNTIKVFSEGKAWVELKDNRKFVIDKTGKEIELLVDYKAPLEYLEIFWDQPTSKFGLKDKKGNVVVSAKFKIISNIYEGLYLCDLNGKYGFLNAYTGREVIPFIYDYAKPFFGGLALVKKDDRYGFIDKSNKAVIPIIYDVVSPFMDGVTEAYLGGKLYYFNLQGNQIK